jgi:hypothetical protein
MGGGMDVDRFQPNYRHYSEDEDKKEGKTEYREVGGMPMESRRIQVGTQATPKAPSDRDTLIAIIANKLSAAEYEQAEVLIAALKQIK